MLKICLWNRIRCVIILSTDWCDDLILTKLNIFHFIRLVSEYVKENVLLPAFVDVEHPDSWFKWLDNLVTKKKILASHNWIYCSGRNWMYTQQHPYLSNEIFIPKSYAILRFYFAVYIWWKSIIKKLNRIFNRVEFKISRRK